MCRVWDIVYNLIVLPLLVVASRLGALVSSKIRQRQRLLRQQRIVQAERKHHGVRTFWFHAASMGELEQIKPLIRLCRSRYNASKIVVSVFSLSAYREHPDISYDTFLLLPHDGRLAAERFLDSVQPDVAIISRYDVWWNLTRLLHRRGIPLIIVNATYPSSPLLQRLRGYLRCLFDRAQIIVARSERHAAHFARLGIHSRIVTLPDTRIDQVLYRLEHSQSDNFDFLDHDRFRLVLGSTWGPDESLWQQLWDALPTSITERIQLLIVPHEPTPSHCARLLRCFVGSIRLSECTDHAKKPSVVIVDKIGLLTCLYRYASAAYVGGGFGRGVHSLLEVAVAGIPVSCGPRIERSEDALELIDAGVLDVISDVHDAKAWLSTVMNDCNCSERARVYRQRLLEHGNVSEVVLALIEQLIGATTSSTAGRR